MFVAQIRHGSSKTVKTMMFCIWFCLPGKTVKLALNSHKNSKQKQNVFSRIFIEESEYRVEVFIMQGKISNEDFCFAACRSKGAFNVDTKSAKCGHVALYMKGVTISVLNF